MGEALAYNAAWPHWRRPTSSSAGVDHSSSGQHDDDHHHDDEGTLLSFCSPAPVHAVEG